MYILKSTLSELDLSELDLEQIRQDLTIHHKNCYIKNCGTEIKLFTENESSITVPRYYGQNLLKSGETYDNPALLLSSEALDLLPYQTEVYKDCMKTLFQYGVINRQFPIGWGSTFFITKIAMSLGGRIVFIVPKKTLIDTWSHSIKRISNQSSENITILTTMSLKHKDVNFSEFQTCVVTNIDEIDRSTLLTILPKITSKYMIGTRTSPVIRNDFPTDITSYYFGPMTDLSELSVHKFKTN
jgi:hypothetical protein